MFVRWTKRERFNHYYRRKEPTGTYSLFGYLVESYRNEDGQPRQRRVAHLGTVHDWDLDNKWHRFHFWRKVDLILDQHVPDNERGKIVAKLCEVIDRPDAGEFETMNRKHKQTLAQFGMKDWL